MLNSLQTPFLSNPVERHLTPSTEQVRYEKDLSFHAFSNVLYVWYIGDIYQGIAIDALEIPLADNVSIYEIDKKHRCSAKVF